MGGLKALKARMAGMEEALQAAAFESLNEARDAIEIDIGVTQATTDSAIVEDKDNRIDTSAMFDSIGSRMGFTDLNITHVEFGWINAPDYAHVQEYGGMSEGLEVGDMYISPMNALKKVHGMWAAGELVDAVLRDLRRAYNA